MVVREGQNITKAKHNLFKHLKRGIRSKSVLQAMERVPRELFVPNESRHMAYLDIPLNIGQGQTISQPYMVALMTSALELLGNERVLEVGTGSGYQAAVLATLLHGGKVISVERIPELAEGARNRLEVMGYVNVEVLRAGATLGCPERAPFDAIIVTAAAPKYPESLLAQLKVGGRMVIPVGAWSQQELVQVLRTDEGLSVGMWGQCRFVPLIGPEAFPEVPSA